MAGKEKPYFHTVAINLDKDVQVNQPDYYISI